MSPASSMRSRRCSTPQFMFIIAALIACFTVTRAQDSTSSAVPSVCAQIVGNTGAACEDYWFSFPTNVITALNSPALASYLCTHPCLPTLKTAAAEFVQHGCPNAGIVAASVDILQNFGCLYNTSVSPPSYCLNQFGAVISALSQSQVVDSHSCAVIANTECCFGSFENVELAAVYLGLFPETVIPMVREVKHNCSAIGIPISPTPCPGAHNDSCQLIFDEISVTCLNFASELTTWIQHASLSQAQNQWLCTHPCYNSTIALLSALAQNHCNVGQSTPWQLLQSTVSFLNNMGCRTNHHGALCLATTYSIFDEENMSPVFATPTTFINPRFTTSRSNAPSTLLEALSMNQRDGTVIGDEEAETRAHLKSASVASGLSQLPQASSMLRAPTFRETGFPRTLFVSSSPKDVSEELPGAWPGRSLVSLTSSADDDDNVDDDGLSFQYTVEQCRNISMMAGCCIGSALNVRVPLGFEFFSTRAATILSQLIPQCAALGVNISTGACPGGFIDPCTKFTFAGVPQDCQAYVISIPVLVAHAQANASTNAFICNSTCRQYVPAVIAAIKAHPECYNIGATNQALQSFLSLLEFACLQNDENNEYCMTQVGPLLLFPTSAPVSPPSAASETETGVQSTKSKSDDVRQNTAADRFSGNNDESPRNSASSPRLEAVLAALASNTPHEYPPAHIGREFARNLEYLDTHLRMQRQRRAAKPSDQRPRLKYDLGYELGLMTMYADESMGAEADGDDDHSLHPSTPTLTQCELAVDAGCCFPSLLSYGFAGVQAGYINPALFSRLNMYQYQCQAIYNITVAPSGCSGGTPSVCAGLLAGLSLDCIAFLLDLPYMIAELRTQQQNAAVCTASCFANVSAVLQQMNEQGCTYVFADGTTTTTLMDYAWFACQQNANGQYCWVDYWNFTNTALQNLSLATCNAAGGLGCCLAGGIEVGYDLYTNGRLSKAAAAALAQLQPVCQQYAQAAPLASQNCYANKPDNSFKREYKMVITIASTVGGFCVALVLVIYFVRRYRRKREGLRGSGLERAPLLPSSSPFLRITAQYDRDDDSADRTFTMPPPRTGRRRFDPLTVNPV